MNVRIVGTPKVKLDLSNAGLAQAGFPAAMKIDPAGNAVTLAGTPQVTLAGTPQVTLVGTQQVSLAGTPTVKLDTGGNEVRIDGTPTVKLDAAANDVDVRSSVASPVITREAPEFWGVAKRLAPASGQVACASLGVPAGRIVRIESVMASSTGAGEPQVSVRLVQRYDPSVATWIDADIPMRSANSVSGFTWVGQRELQHIATGDGYTNSAGLPAQPEACVRAPAGNSASTAVSVTGTYLN